MRGDPFGEAIPSDDLIKGLRQINANINVNSEHAANVWYPGKNTMSCLWLGDPGGKSKKISAFHYGAIPEFTQLNPEDGSIMIKGWRAIFDAVIRSRAATQAQVERKFRVSLETILGADERCIKCVRAGRSRRHNGGQLRLCSPHEHIREAAKGLLEKTRDM